MRVACAPSWVTVFLAALLSLHVACQDLYTLGLWGKSYAGYGKGDWSDMRKANFIPYIDLMPVIENCSTVQIYFAGASYAFCSSPGGHFARIERRSGGKLRVSGTSAACPQSATVNYNGISPTTSSCTLYKLLTPAPTEPPPTTTTVTTTTTTARLTPSTSPTPPPTLINPPPGIIGLATVTAVSSAALTNFVAIGCAAGGVVIIVVAGVLMWYRRRQSFVASHPFVGVHRLRKGGASIIDSRTASAVKVVGKTNTVKTVQMVAIEKGISVPLPLGRYDGPHAQLENPKMQGMKKRKMTSITIQRREQLLKALLAINGPQSTFLAKVWSGTLEVEPGVQFPPPGATIPTPLQSIVQQQQSSDPEQEQTMSQVSSMPQPQPLPQPMLQQSVAQPPYNQQPVKRPSLLSSQIGTPMVPPPKTPMAPPGSRPSRGTSNDDSGDDDKNENDEDDDCDEYVDNGEDLSLFDDE